MTDKQQNNADKVKVSIRYFTVLVLVMFGFGFAMVPLYDMLCSVTGLNGSNTGVQDESQLSGVVDYSRTIRVEFDATNNADLPWEFYPMTKSVDVHPGEVKEVSYYAKNNSSKAIIAQAIPGVTPWQATSHFNKTECFCFTKQKLEAGEGKVMPLRFVISADLPENFTTITLSYTFMDTDRTKLMQAKKLPQLQSSL